MNVLILDGNSNAGRAILQSLGRAGHSCLLAAPDTRSSAFRSRYATQVFTYPDPLRDRLLFQSWVTGFLEEHDCDLVIPATELTLIPLDALRGDRSIRAKLALPSGDALENVLDKEKLVQIARSLNIRIPPSKFVSGDMSHDIGGLARAIDNYPVVVKPVRSKVWVHDSGTGLHARIARSRDQLEHYLQLFLQFGGVQIQQWVPGIGFGVEVLADRGKVVLEFAHQRVHELPLTGGASSYRKSVPVPAKLRESTSALIRTLGWHGPAMVEFRVDSATGREWLMEVNGRFWGSLPLAIRCGADFPLAWAELFLNDRTEPQTPVRLGYFARNFSDDFQWIKDRIRQQKGDPLIADKSLPIALFEWLRVLTGRDAWDGGSWRDPQPLFHELYTTLRNEFRQFAARARRRLLDIGVRRGLSTGLRQLTTAHNLLVLCYGNICRSPYAAMRLEEWGKPLQIQVRSSGFHRAIGRRSPALFQRVAYSRGVELSEHRSIAVEKEALDWADTIILMDRENLSRLRRENPAVCKKALLLGMFSDSADLEIRDPYGMSVVDIDAILERIDDSVHALVEILGSHSSPTGTKAVSD